MNALLVQLTVPSGFSKSDKRTFRAISSPWNGEKRLVEIDDLASFMFTMNRLAITFSFELKG